MHTVKRMFAGMFFLLLVAVDLIARDETPLEPLKVVLWLGGFAHEFEKVGEILQEKLPQQLSLNMTVAWNGGFLDSDERPDIILMYHCHTSAEGIVTEKQKEKLLAMVREGVGVVALHASYYSFVEWDGYHEFYGARFIKHGKADALLKVIPQNTRHPIMKGVEPPLELVSELYQSTPLAKDCQVLAHSEDTKEGIPRPSVWTRKYGKGRIVTILPGHWVENFNDTAFQRLIVNSLKWVVEDGENEVSEVIADQYDWEEDALRSFKLPAGFEINLVAAEPYLANPVSMTLDDEGTVYASNAHSYRQKWWLMDPPPPFEPTNPIMRFEIGPDGRAVEATLVADGFENPVMGLAVRDQRLWATNLNRLFVTELDEEGGMTRELKSLIRDAATPWNPFGMYRVAFGPDGLMYLSVGDHETKLTGATGNSSVRLDQGGSGAVFRFHEDGSNIELLLQGMRAPFTFGFTPFGQHWVIANGEGSPNTLIDAVYGTDYRFRNKTRGKWSWLNGSDPLSAPVWETPAGAHTAVLPYYSSAFPQAYWGNLFLSNFGVHGEPAKKNEVLRLILDDRGGVSHSEVFLSSSDPKFRPTQVCLAPDGSLYMLDWYGKDDDNDLTGRLYRITYKGKNATRKFEKGLGSRNHVQRRKAKEALLAAGSENSLPIIDRVLSETNALAAAEALWTLRVSNWTHAADHIRKAVIHGDWRVRRLSVQLLRELDRQEEDTLRMLLNDSDPAVRIEAALGFRDLSDRCTALVQALGGGAAEDRRLRFMAALEIGRQGQRAHFSALLNHKDPEVRFAGLVALDEAFYESSKGFMNSGTGVAPASIARKVLAEFIAQPGQIDVGELLDLARRWPHDSLKDSVFELVIGRLRSGDLSMSEFAQGLETLEQMGLPATNEVIDKARESLLQEARQTEVSDVGEQLALLKILEAGQSRAKDLSLLRALITSENTAVRAKAYNLLAARFAGKAAAVAICRDVGLNASAGFAQRLDAVAALAKLQPSLDEGTWTKLLLSSSREIALASLRSLQTRADRATVGRFLETLSERLRKRHGPAIENDLKFSSAVLAGTPVDGREKDLLRQNVLANISKGNPELGRLVFQTRACFSCHGDEGALLPAPKLDHIASTHDAEYLLDSILYPDKAVKTGFLTQVITVVNPGGGEETLTGTLHPNVSGDGKWVEVTDSSGQAKLHRSASIKNVNVISVMPAGLEAGMSSTELVDLVAYLKTLK